MSVDRKEKIFRCQCHDICNLSSVLNVIIKCLCSIPETLRNISLMLVFCINIKPLKSVGVRVCLMFDHLFHGLFYYLYNLRPRESSGLNKDMLSHVPVLRIKFKHSETPDQPPSRHVFDLSWSVSEVVENMAWLFLLLLFSHRYFTPPAKRTRNH